MKSVNKYNIVPDREQIEIFDPNVKNAISGVNHMEEAIEEIINMCSFDDTEKLDRLKSLAESSANFALTNIYDSYIKG